MRPLLDENVPHKLKQDLESHEVHTVRGFRQDGSEDEAILQFLNDSDFDALITCDKNLQYQQNLNRYPTPILVLDIYTNAYPVLKALVPNLLKILQSPLPSGTVVIVKL